jgi:hypothetical protein
MNRTIIEIHRFHPNKEVKKTLNALRPLPAPSSPALRPGSRPRAGELDGFLGGADQRARLVAPFLVFGLGVAVGDAAAACLDVHLAVLDQGGAQGDAGVHVAVGAKVADGARIEAAPLGLQPVDGLHRPDSRRAAGRAGGACDRGVEPELKRTDLEQLRLSLGAFPL